MKQLLLTVGLLIVSTCIYADELWERAVLHFSKNTGWIAGTTEILTEHYNRKGEIRSTERRVNQSRIVPDGIETIVFYAEKNGEDITAEERRNADKQRQKRDDEERKMRAREIGSDQSGESADPESESESGFPNPFDPDRKDTVSYAQNGRSLVVEGASLIGYDFQMQADEKTNYIVGTVFIDPGSAVPVEIDATMEPLPRFASSARLFVRYNNDTERWHAMYMEIEGAGGWLLIYRHIKSTITFSDYFQLDG